MEGQDSMSSTIIQRLFVSDRVSRAFEEQVFDPLGPVLRQD
jgi:hypothetical protein